MNIVSVYEMNSALTPVQPEAAQAVIKVVGAGGGGSNAVNRMIERGLSGVEFIAVNTDARHLAEKSMAETKLQIGGKVTHGWGAGGKPEMGEKAANEDSEEIARVLSGANMVFVTAGMGGGTGTGSAPVIAKTAKEQGALTVAVVTKPFDCEGRYKMKLAEEGIKKLREAVDTLITIPNQNLFKLVDRNTTFPQACQLADEVLRQGVQGISDIITQTGEVNIDFADVESIMKGQGDALMGIGIGSGENRGKDAAESAIDNPMLEDSSIEGATRILINIAGDNIGMVETGEIMDTIRSKADPDAEIIFGVTTDPDLGSNIRVTVIATGFKPAAKAAIQAAESGRKPETDVIDISTFERIKAQSAQRPRPDYLPPRNYSDDLDIPTLIRDPNYGKPAEKAAGGTGL